MCPGAEFSLLMSAEFLLLYRRRAVVPCLGTTTLLTQPPSTEKDHDEVREEARAREEGEPDGGRGRPAARERLGVREEEELQVVQGGRVCPAASIDELGLSVMDDKRTPTGCGRRRR